MMSDNKKRHVATYIRTAQDSMPLVDDLTLQTAFYDNYIHANPEWEFIGSYADMNVSGFRTENRSGFRHMIDDAMDGKIDIILARSLSCFARSADDLHSTIRKLNEKGVEIFFVKDGISSFHELFTTMVDILTQWSQMPHAEMHGHGYPSCYSMAAMKKEATHGKSKHKIIRWLKHAE